MKKKDHMKMWDIAQKMMMVYKQQHEDEYPLHTVCVYGNFVECNHCEAHAHVHFSDETPSMLVEHNGDYTVYNIVTMEDLGISLREEMTNG